MTSSSDLLVYLSASDLLGLVGSLEMVAAIERAATALLRGEAAAPLRAHLEGEACTLLVMPSQAPSLFCTKLVTVTPGNAKTDLPVTQGIAVLIDGSDGRPIALLDAAALTAQRTGAVVATAIKHLAPPHLDRLAIVGCGIQGTWAAISATAVRPIRTIICCDESEASLARFRASMAHFAPEVTIERRANSAELLASAPCLIAATTSQNPVLPDDTRCFGNQLLISIGSYRPDMQEFPDCAYRLTPTVFVDSPHGIHETGDLINPLKGGLISQQDIVSLGDLIADAQHTERDGVRIFKSVGHATFDLFAAEMLYSAARVRGIGQLLETG